MERQQAAPHFIGIGLGKSGTTWLHWQLENHPEIWVPPVKEINYFDVYYDSYLKRFYGKHHYHRNWRRWAVKYFLHFAYLYSPQNMIWRFKYLFYPRSFSWYISLFPQNDKFTCGEISPAYILLPEKTISKIALRLPNIKLIYLIRNPIDWIWSAVKWEYLKIESKKKFDRDFHDYFNNYLNDRIFMQRLNHITNIKKWKKYFKKEQIFIGFFDDIKNYPSEFLKELSGFLEIDYRGFRAESMNKIINKNIAGDRYIIPGDVKIRLAKHLLPCLQELSREYGGHCKVWLEEAENLIK